MREKVLYGIWGCLYILCVGLGFVSEPEGLGKVLLVLTALIFFLPGFVLLYDGIRNKNRRQLFRLRMVCLCSLVLTLGFLIANFLSVRASAAVGAVLYELLVLVSAPMVCAQYWLLSQFLWAVLLISTVVGRKHIKD